MRFASVGLHHLAQKAGLSWDEAPGAQVTLPAGESDVVVGKCRVHVRNKAYHCLVSFHAMRLADRFDAIFGDPWLAQHSQ